jgi:hypothetical protein
MDWAATAVFIYRELAVFVDVTSHTCRTGNTEILIINALLDDRESGMDA